MILFAGLAIIYPMAPIATSTHPSPPDAPAVAVPKNFGNYKEQAAGAKAFNKKLEEEGDVDRPKANVVDNCACDDAVLMECCSISIISQHGTQTRSILQ